MPIYEYECNACTHQFEALVRDLSARSRCPACEGMDLTKLISSGGFILKGGGWFKDGYSKAKESEK